MVYNEFRSAVKKVMKIGEDKNLCKTDEGILAWKCDKIADYCYLCRINRPLSMIEINDIENRIGRNFSELAKLFYLSFNGFDFFNAEFYGFGLQPALINRQGESIQNIPFDIVRKNTFGRPPKADDQFIIFSASTGASSTIYDAFNSDNIIISGEFDVSGKIIDQWTDPVEWIICRVSEAAKRFNNCNPNTMPTEIEYLCEK